MIDGQYVADDWEIKKSDQWSLLIGKSQQEVIHEIIWLNCETRATVRHQHCSGHQLTAIDSIGPQWADAVVSFSCQHLAGNQSDR